MQFDAKGDTDGGGAVVFHFQWQNPNESLAIVNARALIALNGHCETYANGGYWPGDRHASMDLSAALYGVPTWTPPPPGMGQNLAVLHLESDAGGWWDLPDYDPYTVNFPAITPSFDMFVIPPNGLATFEAIFDVSYWVSDGFAEADFEGGGFQVLCPFVELVILTGL